MMITREGGEEESALAGMELMPMKTLLLPRVERSGLLMIWDQYEDEGHAHHHCTVCKPPILRGNLRCNALGFTLCLTCICFLTENQLLENCLIQWDGTGLLMRLEFRIFPVTPSITGMVCMNRHSGEIFQNNFDICIYIQYFILNCDHHAEHQIKPIFKIIL